MVRTAHVSGARDADQVAAYLPSNYKVIGGDEKVIVIQGEDYAGWTLDGYVIPRLGSGLMGCREVTTP